MKPAEVQSQLRSARVEMERVCKMLESPTPAVLDRCSAAMERVIGELDGGRKWMPQAGEIGVEEARRLRSVVRRARALLNLAANYHGRWHCILASKTGGYTVRGAPAPLPSKTRVSIQG
jgi:hypothetical protein